MHQVYCMFLKNKFLLLLLCVLFFCNCHYQSRQGAINDVVVITSQQDKKHIYQLWNNIMSDTLWSPMPEQKYNYIWIEPLEFKSYQHYGNIVSISLKHSSKN